MNGTAMAFPQIDAATSAILITLALWIWTRLKLPTGFRFQEATLRRQNIYIHWTFGVFLVLELIAFHWPTKNLAWIIGPVSGLVFYLFAVNAYKGDAGFWSKRRNQLLGLTITVLVSFTTGLVFKEASFIPLFAALAVGRLCNKRTMQTLLASIKDIETLQAKLLKQEAAYANLRHFEALQSRPTSKQAQG